MMPRLACDCHMHVYDARVPAMAGARLHPPDASLPDYRAVQRQIGTTRVVVVTPSTYGTDNRLMLSAVKALGAYGRGVAVIKGDEGLPHLQSLHAQGVRGVRLNLSQGILHTIDDIKPIAMAIAPLGWHLQLLMPNETLLQAAHLLRNLPVPIVFDHFARVSPERFADNPAYVSVIELLQTNKAWLKLSGGYIVSPQKTSEDPALDALAQSLMAEAPERMLWGSDWPHATARLGLQPMPDDKKQMDCLSRWAQTPEQLQKILIDNPEKLYGF